MRKFSVILTLFLLAISLTSCNKEDSVTITFVENGGSEVADIIVNANSTSIDLPESIQIGYTFNGWYLDKDLTQPFNEVLLENKLIILYAKWTINNYTITFEENGGSVVVDINQPYNSLLTTPATPYRNGYVFDGWYSDAPLTILYTFTTMPAENITLYAKWIINNYTITFEENGGSLVVNLNQPYNSLVTAPVTPTRNGYVFDGWYSDILLSNLYIFTTMPAENITLYAKWTPAQYTIIFNENGGTDVPNITQDYLSHITAPIAPTKLGYTFVGWYSDATLTTLYTFTTMPHQGIELFAKWTVNSYTINFEENGGSMVNDITLDYMTSLEQPELPTKEGFMFSGWYSDVLLTTPYLFTTMPAHNTTLYAKWTIKQYTITYYSSNDIDPLSHIILYPDETIIQISMGGINSSVLTSSGRIFIWGTNDYGELGDGTNVYKLVPTEITNKFSLDDGDKIIQISLGLFHSSALTSSGRLFLWGKNNYGQIGDNSTIDKSIPTEITSSFNLMSDDQVIQVILTGYHSSALTSKGKLFMWGFNQIGQLGDDTTTNRYIPTEITNRFNLASGDQITQVSLGVENSSALTSSGRLFIWGYNGYSLMNERDMQVLVPIEITINLASDDKITQVSLGQSYASVLTLSGRLFVWGRNNYGQLGDGTTINKTWPTEITNQFNLESGDQINQVSLAVFHSSAITLSGRIFMWGTNDHGLLGDNTTISKLVPTEITNQFGLEIGDQINQVSLGYLHSSVLTLNGRIFMWGRSNAGQLGDNIPQSLLVPTELIVHAYERHMSIYNYQSTINYIPTRDGFSLDGWYSDTALTTPFKIEKMPAENIKLYGKWVVEHPKAETLIIFYVRQSNDYTGWNIWLWPYEPISGSGSSYQFTGDNEFGKVLILNLIGTNLEESTKIGVIVRLGDWLAKDVEEDRYIDLTNPNEHGEIMVYIYEGDPIIYFENR